MLEKGDLNLPVSTSYSPIILQDEQITNDLPEINSLDEVSESSASLFPEFSHQQPESTSTLVELQPTYSLAVLAGARKLSPLTTTIRILDEVTRSRSLHELSNEYTFLTDITINAFCVSLF